MNGDPWFRLMKAAHRDLIAGGGARTTGASAI